MSNATRKKSLKKFKKKIGISDIDHLPQFTPAVMLNKPGKEHLQGDAV
jgi:hypothetical protein